ncbi:MAG: OmpA family protein [Leptospirales bacterium]|nr:OmpA family protein [Leptospirales bacterium]
MKKALILSISSLMVIAFLSSCGDGQVKDDPAAGAGGDYVIDSINKQVKDFSIDGFAGGSAQLKENEDLENMKKIVSIVHPMIEKIPDGYEMQITGHCADFDSAAMKKSVSTARAKKVYDELKNAGASESKMAYKGVGIDEPIPGLDGKDARQRRVSFQAVKK